MCSTQGWSKTDSGCWASLDAKTHIGLFGAFLLGCLYCAPVSQSELPWWKRLIFLGCSESTSKNHTLHMSLPWAPDVSLKVSQLQIWLLPKEDRIECVVRKLEEELAINQTSLRLLHLTASSCSLNYSQSEECQMHTVETVEKYNSQQLPEWAALFSFLSWGLWS